MHLFWVRMSSLEVPNLIPVKEVQREMTAKAGQKCTAIRRIIAPEAQVEALIDALKSRLAQTVIGNPHSKRRSAQVN